MPGQATIKIGDKQWQVSLAITPWELTTGLGGIPGIPPEAGMLFDIGYESTITITTELLLFPIDIAFISSSPTVVEIARNVPPGYLVRSSRPTRFFLEVNAGETEGVVEGDAVNIELLPGQETDGLSGWISSLFALAATMMVMGLCFGMVKGTGAGNPERHHDRPFHSGNPSHSDLEEWLEEMKSVLVKRTGRNDIEITGGPYRGYDVKVSHAVDCHPVVDLYTPMRYDPLRVEAALDYAVRLIEDWEATLAAQEKDMRIVQPHFERLKAMFPDLGLRYTVRYGETHFVQAKREKDKTAISFDLWPAMKGSDIERIADYVKDFVRELSQPGGPSMIGTEYW